MTTLSNAVATRGSADKTAAAAIPVSHHKYEVVAARSLTDEQLADWQSIRASCSRYRSPFFSPGFVRNVSRILPDIDVLLVSESGGYVGFLPFQRRGGHEARPAGMGINDAHGLIAADDAEIDVTEMLASVGLTRFAFHASPPDAPGVGGYETGRRSSFLADLTVDSQGYANFLRRRHSTIARQGQKTRKLARDLGPLRFEFECRDTQMLRRLIELKRQQYQRTHTFDIFSIGWIQELLAQFRLTPDDEPRGILSVLYAGEVPVALHYGMIEGDLLHYWFPVFDPAYGYGSPGTELFLRVVAAAESVGIRAIDMGYGEQAYKHKLTNVQTEMSYGLIDPSPLRRALHSSRLALRAKLKDLKLREQLKPWARRLMPHIGKGIYE